MIAIAALAGGAQNWLLTRCRLAERLLLIAGGLLLVYPKPLFDWIGIALIAVVLATQKLLKSDAKV